MKKMSTYLHRLLLLAAVTALIFLLLFGSRQDSQARQNGEEFRPQKGQFVLQLQEQEVRYATVTDNLCEGQETGQDC